MSTTLANNVGVCENWKEFVLKYYERKPCLIDLTEFGGVPFRESQALESIRLSFDRERGNRVHSSKERRIHLNNVSVEEAFIGKDQLPQEGDDFTSFIERYFDKLDAEDLTVVLHNCHRYAPDIYKAARAFLLPLQERVGLPSGFVGTDMFAGKYRTNPKSLHKDTGAVFMFPLVNEKTMAIWPWDHFSKEAPDSRFVNAALDVPYQDHLPSATMITARPGQAIYFPSHWWHLACSDDVAPTLSLNVTWYMPTTARDIIAPVVERALRSPDLALRFDHLPLLRPPACSEDALELPPPISDFMKALERSFRYYLLQRGSSGGFIGGARSERPPSMSPRSSVRIADRRFPIRCVEQGDGALVMVAEGQVLRTQQEPAVMTLVSALNEGRLVGLDEMASEPGLRDLVGELLRIGAIETE